jgi:8-oxo-dGTP pyrophosphatase MutT (NUDIX family)
MRRTERVGDAWSGHWSFPGGRRDRTDFDLLATALRELEEECSVRLTRDDLEATIPPAFAGRRAGQFLLVAPFLFRVEGERAVVPNPGEAVEAVWVPLGLLRDRQRHRLQAVPGLPEHVLFPAVDLNGVPLWGFTYRLIADWLRLGPALQPPELAGFEAARLTLDFLVSHGMQVTEDWREREVAETALGRPGVVKMADMAGSIPTDLVLSRFSAPGCHVAAISRLEVAPNAIRISGPRFEEYWIRTVA